MVQKAKKNYFKNLNVRNITDNKQFWNTVKPFFSSKVGGNERVTLIEGDKVVSEDREVTETFKPYFESIVKNLGINSKFMSEGPVSNESANDINRKFQNHPSIIKIKDINLDIFSEFIMHNFNEDVSIAKFPDILKIAEIKPVFKKKSRIDKENYRPVNILPVISKIFERLIFRQLIMFFEPVFSKYQCEFRKDHSAQYCLLIMTEKRRKRSR